MMGRDDDRRIGRENDIKSRGCWGVRGGEGGVKMGDGRRDREMEGERDIFTYGR